MRICILGWGSLYWDKVPVFDEMHGPWQLDGPRLKLEFSRVSQKSRLGALTLVIDPLNGADCQVAYADSKRQDPEDAICDLRNREGTVRNRIGFFFLDGSRSHGGDETTRTSIRGWAVERGIDVAVWTDLPTNFQAETGIQFSVDQACRYLQDLPAEGKAKAAEYVWCAPEFVSTPLRSRLPQEPWFPRKPASV